MENLNLNDIYKTIKMPEDDMFDIRTVTLGIDLFSCVRSSIDKTNKAIEQKIGMVARDLVAQAKKLESEYGIPIVNKRLTLTPASLVLASLFKNDKEHDLDICLRYAKNLDKIASQLGVDFIGGYGCLCDLGETYADKIIIESLPMVLSKTERVCSFVGVASSKSGINMDTVARLGKVVHDTANNSENAIGCAKLVVFCNAVNDNPFMAGGFHGVNSRDAVVNVGISGPGVVKNVIKNLPTDMPLDALANEIKKTAFKITRVGELIGRRMAGELKFKFGSVDLSLAPTTQIGDSIGEILELIGVDKVGTHGTTVALALLTDAVKKGGVMASANIGGLSGAFIPVSEDTVLSESVKDGCLTLDKLEAMTAICSVGLDMVAIPGDTRTTTISAIIADEMAIGMMNHKTTAVRIIPVPGKQAGEHVSWGGLLGGAYIIPVHEERADRLVWRKGRVPAPISGFRN